MRRYQAQALALFLVLTAPEIVALLLEKGATGADDILAQGVRTGNKALVEAELARNEMDEVLMSTPAVSDGVLVVRTAGHVYGLGETPAPEGAAEEETR